MTHARCSSPACPSCRTCSGFDRSTFRDLPPDVTNALDRNRELIRLQDREALFEVGDRPLYFYCVRTGILALEGASPQGRHHLLHLKEQGDIVGYRSLFSEEPHAFTARAKGNVEVCRFPVQAVIETIQRFPRLGLRILAYAAREASESDARVMALTEKSAKARVAEAILLVTGHFKERSPWTRREIAEWAGTTPETVMRVLSEWDQAGLLARKGRRIEVLRRDLLAAEADLEP